MKTMIRHLTRATRTAVVATGCMIGLACSASESGREDTTVAQTRAGPAADSIVVTVYKSPTCGCCTAWVEHLRKEGFRVVAIDTADIDAIKRRQGVTQELSSCHTAVVGDYVIEGHVPAADIRRLLAERPQIRGLAAPGMPQGSPGMETGVRDRYDVLSFTREGRTAVFATH